ncbi:MAG: toxin-antitoxin system HicB family antitoxin [Hyphomicrobiales bacterium]|nr:toxin-antitoxin system HicB family antitoxin [Hyphomicrobiales bacterium]
MNLLNRVPPGSKPDESNPDAESGGALKRPLKAEPKTATVNLRLTPSLKSAAERAADDDSRSLPSLIEKLLKDDLQARGYLEKSARQR